MSVLALLGNVCPIQNLFTCIGHACAAECWLLYLAMGPLGRCSPAIVLPDCTTAAGIDDERLQLRLRPNEKRKSASVSLFPNVSVTAVQT